MGPHPPRRPARRLERVTFGGHLDAAEIDDIVVAAFASQAPLLSRGGHSRAWDVGAEAVGAFFGRLTGGGRLCASFEEAEFGADAR